MATDYYSASGAPGTSSAGESAPMRAEFAAIEAGFAKLPDLTTVGDRIVHVNAGSTALVTTAGFTFDGTTLTVPAVANATLSNGGALRTSTTSGHTALIQAYDNDTGPGYVTFGTLTAGNTPSFELDNTILDTAVAKGTWTASGTWTIPAVTTGGLITLGANIATGANYISNAGTNAGLSLDASNNATLSGALTVSGAGPHAIGGASVGFEQVRITGSFTSSGASTLLIGLALDMALTGAAGDTSYLTQFSNVGTITTQGATETIGLVASVRLNEPQITVGTGDTITTAATLYIANAPTEGATNAALYVASGATYLQALNVASTVTLSGTAANIATGANFISYGGTDAGFSLDASNNATLSGTLTVSGASITVGAGFMQAGARNQFTSSGRISVSTATTIFTHATGGSSVGRSGALVVVNGYEIATPTNTFIDLVLVQSGQTPVTVSQSTTGASSRTYTSSGAALQLAMGSGTYNVSSSWIEQAN